MAEVLPLPGLRFSGVPLGEVIAPPFDVISPEQQAALYDRGAYNVVRLELGREADRYAEAARSLQAWRTGGVLRQDEPSFYLYEQRFQSPASGAPHARRALLARVTLEPWSAGVVLPHEDTHTKAKEDRLQLMHAVRANVSPVFGLYDDPQGELRPLLAPLWDGAPAAEATDDAGEVHRLWVVPAAALAEDVTRFFSTRQLFIADGHHRYETALNYRNERRAEGSNAADAVMMALVDFYDPGLVVLPTHRLFHSLTPRQLDGLNDGLAKYFDVTAAAESASPHAIQAALDHIAAAQAPAAVLYGPLPSGLRVLELKPAWRDRSFDDSRSPAWNRLDVSIVHAVLERALRMTAEDAAGQRFVRYEQEPAAAIREVQRGGAQFALLLRPTPATAIRDVASAGDKMPQKSTYFYPKLATGLVINPLG